MQKKKKRFIRRAKMILGQTIIFQKVLHLNHQKKF